MKCLVEVLNAFVITIFKFPQSLFPNNLSIFLVNNLQYHANVHFISNQRANTGAPAIYAVASATANTTRNAYTHRL